MTSGVPRDAQFAKFRRNLNRDIGAGMSLLANKIYYSSVNEDSTSEYRALRIQPTDRILCITGSGARPLDLLVKSPGEVVSIDLNPLQNFLFELKLAALKHFEYDEFLDFLGITNRRNRIAAYKKIRSSLSFNVRGYWDRHQSDIHHGVFYTGNWEKYFRILSLYLQATRKKMLTALFSCSSIEKQEEVWNTQWENPVWRTFLRSVSMRAVWRYFLRDPGFYMYVPADFSIYRYLHGRLIRASLHILLKESPFALILFNGKLSENGALPPHLQRQHYESLQSQIDRIKVKNVSLSSIDTSRDVGTFDAFSLSDFSSYTDIKEYEKCWEAIGKRSSAGARICERQFLVKRDIPDQVKNIFIRDPELEDTLSGNDNSIFYTFICASVK
jgi:S-adenosylmethionine-diacylglycerol 3-amino-3-carboxypropyl transferase